MILLSIALLSLSVIYFTRLLSERNMKVAAIAVATLYFYIIAWIYAIFILDIADLGFSDTETRISLLHGSDIYHSFVDITEKMSVVPIEWLKAIVAVVVITLVAGFSVAFHGVFEITRAVVRAAKEKTLFKLLGDPHNTTLIPWTQINSGELLRLHCRMNC